MTPAEGPKIERCVPNTGDSSFCELHRQPVRWCANTLASRCETAEAEVRSLKAIAEDRTPFERIKKLRDQRQALRAIVDYVSQFPCERDKCLYGNGKCAATVKWESLIDAAHVVGALEDR